MTEGQLCHFPSPQPDAFGPYTLVSSFTQRAARAVYALQQTGAPLCPALARVRLGLSVWIQEEKNGWRQSGHRAVLHGVTFKHLPAAASSKGKLVQEAGSVGQHLPSNLAQLAGAYSSSALWWQMKSSPTFPACEEGCGCAESWASLSPCEYKVMKSRSISKHSDKRRYAFQKIVQIQLRLKFSAQQQFLLVIALWKQRLFCSVTRAHFLYGNGCHKQERNTFLSLSECPHASFTSMKTLGTV